MPEDKSSGPSRRRRAAQIAALALSVVALCGVVGSVIAGETTLGEHLRRVGNGAIGLAAVFMLIAGRGKESTSSVRVSPQTARVMLLGVLGITSAALVGLSLGLAVLAEGEEPLLTTGSLAGVCGLVGFGTVLVVLMGRTLRWLGSCLLMFMIWFSVLLWVSI